MTNRMLLAGLAMLPLGAGANEFANDFDYSYVEGTYVKSEIDGPVDIKGDGFGVRGSFAVADGFHVFGSYLTQDMDFGLDITTYDLGAGIHWGLQRDLHFIGELAWVNVKAETSFASAKDDGYSVGAGLRFRPMGNLELKGMITYVDVADSDTLYSVGARYHFTNTVSIGGGFELGDDLTMWNLGVRAQFGANGRGRR
jgi:opacity protein-like surface antigen